MAAVTLDDLDTRQERRRVDRLCLAREVFNAVDVSLHHHFRPSECLTVDESLVKFRERCLFRVYIYAEQAKTVRHSDQIYE